MFDEYDDNDSDNLENYFKKMKESQLHMFMMDVKRFVHSPIPLTPDEYVEIFDEYPDDECYEIMTERLLKDWNIFGEYNIGVIIDKWGCDWLGDLLKYNVEIEKYELCSIIKTIIDCSDRYLEKIK